MTIPVKKITDLTPIDIPDSESVLELATLTLSNQVKLARARWTKGADLVSAAALLVTTLGNSFDVTGTTTITSIAATSIGTIIKLHFNGALTLTHNPTSLILPGGANFVTSPGDEFELQHFSGANNYRVTGYSLISGKSIVTELIDDTTPELGGNLDGGGFDITNVGAIVATSIDAGSGAIQTLGNLTVGATTLLNGNVTLGDGTGDLIAAKGRMSFIAGTVSNPGIKFEGQTNTGISFATGEIRFGIAGANVGTAKAAGLELASGKNIILASGAGIDFSATGDGTGTATSELLNDYEEGTFPPVLSDGTNDATPVAAIGRYTKVGNRIHGQIRLVLSSLGSVSGDIQIDGLPYQASTAASATSPVTASGDNLSLTAGNSVTGKILSATSRITLEVWDDAGGVTNMQASEYTASGDVVFGFTYEVA